MATNPQPLTIPDFWSYDRHKRGVTIPLLYYVQLADGRRVWVTEREYQAYRRQAA